MKTLNALSKRKLLALLDHLSDCVEGPHAFNKKLITDCLVAFMPSLPLRSSDVSFVFSLSGLKKDMDHVKEALAALQDINKQLLIVSAMDIPENVESHCEEARTHIIAAIRELDPKLPGAHIPSEELAPAEFNALTEESAGSFSSLTDPTTDKIKNNDSSKN